MMLGFIKRLFPIKVDSFDEFVEILKEENCNFVEAKGVQEEKGSGPRVPRIGRIGDFEYSLALKSETSSGRPVIFEGSLGTRFGSSKGFSDAKERNKKARKVIIAAVINLERIKKKIPGIQTDVVTPQGKLDKKMYNRLHKQAKEV